VWSLYNKNLIAKVEETSKITQIKSHKNLYLKLKIKLKLQTFYFSIKISLNVIHTPHKTKTHTQKIYIKHASRSPKVLKVKCNLSKNSNNSIRSSDVLLAQGERKNNSKPNQKQQRKIHENTQNLKWKVHNVRKGKP